MIFKTIAFLVNSLNSFSNKKFLDGSINSKTNNGVIKYIYFIQKTNTSHKQKIKENKTKNIPLKYMNSPGSNDLRYQTGVKSSSKPCDKLCNGIERIKRHSKCLNTLLDSKLCQKDDYIERPCNTHCKLQ